MAWLQDGLGEQVRGAMAWAFGGMALHAMYVHGISKWPVVLAGLALGVHPAITKKIIKPKP